ncbi:hypothetical protein BKA82DRAFT_1007751 [Pisolithus tinctorius]|uniref:Transmembrane protein n=1 Tax=Pisolithus tinctorius Marx 270 TaxID=870435 RepID=A0A0C3NIA3_PISTI|nr:hypothetical protein BKA82DRAFT_1007751 [Pisolithus tinctorius]KIN95148.1 hypothetical protein M404DRAFT_1007751 [Pisolithus tinctorius Marx 270]
MLVSQALLRILVRLPKLFIAIAKRCSSTTLPLFRYLLSLWNPFIHKQKQKHLLDNDAHNVLASNLPILSAGFRNTTIPYGEGGESVSGPAQPGSSKPEVELSDINRGRPRSDANDDQIPPHGYPATQTRPQRRRRANPLIRNFGSSTPSSSIHLTVFLVILDITSMMVFLDRLRYVSSALAATQVDDQTDLDKWEAFSKTFQSEVDASNLLSTVLLATNVGFLAIQSIDQEGLSYWSQRLCYMSLFASLASVTTGLAVRTPRFFTAHRGLWFSAMQWCLFSPFGSLLSSVYFFLAALLVHLRHQAATVQLYFAFAGTVYVVCMLIVYALVTEPQGIRSVLYLLNWARTEVRHGAHSVQQHWIT